MIYTENVKIPLKDINNDLTITDRGILEIFENVSSHHSDMIGYGVTSRNENGFTWILMDWNVKVLKRPKYGENIWVSTWARYINGELKKAYTYRDFEAINESGEVCIIATSKWVVINTETRRIIHIDENIMRAYGLEDKSVFEEQELEKLKEPKEFIFESEYIVKRSDVDFVSHVHNLYYIDLAYNALPENVYNLKPFSQVRIAYKKEIKLGDKIKCKYTKQNEMHIVCIFDEQDKLHSMITLNA